MTREDSIRLKTWVTNDGRYLTVDQITPNHLRAIQAMLRRELTPGYDEAAGREIARDFVARHESILDYTIELDHDAFRAAWLQIIDNELAQRVTRQGSVWIDQERGLCAVREHADGSVWFRLPVGYQADDDWVKLPAHFLTDVAWNEALA